MIKIERVDGDLSATRNLAIGGDAVIEGSALISHNLIVAGTLEARNICGPERGLYASAAALNEAWPDPEPGWWALVGTTLPALVYMVQEGEWVSTGRLAGEPIVEVDSEALSELRLQLAQFEAAIDRMQTQVGYALRDAADAEGSAREAAQSVEQLSAKIEQTQSDLEEALVQIDAATAAMHSPCLVFFSGVVDSAIWKAGKSALSSTSAQATIIYARLLKCFMLNTLEIVNGVPTPVNYRDWADRDLFSDDQLQPHTDRLYAERATGTLYLGKGGTLVAVS